jgi:peptidoglycan LD-endopeptidase CwlK
MIRRTWDTIRAGKYDWTGVVGILIAAWPKIAEFMADVPLPPKWQQAFYAVGVVVTWLGKSGLVVAPEESAPSEVQSLMARGALPKAPREVPVVSSLDGLAPKFRNALVKTCDDVETATGVRPRVFETLRTQARQSFIHGFGRRYDDGRGIVTHSADADESWHWERFGLAADLIHPTLRWAAPAEYWDAIGKAAKANGLTWGGDWDGNPNTRNGFSDRPHVQWGRCRRSPSPRARRIVDTDGTPALWREVGAA